MTQPYPLTGTLLIPGTRMRLPLRLRSNGLLGSHWVVGRQPFPYRIMEAMWKSTTRQFESHLLRAVSDHRCEITGVKFQAGLLSH